MHLSVSLVPRAGVCQAVSEVVRDASRPVTPADKGLSASAPLGGRLRLGRRKCAVEQPSSPATPQLDLVPPSQMQIPVASFGNVTARDAELIEQAIRRAAAALAPPTVHLAGSAALEFPGDRAVWAKVAGDVDTLRRIPPAVTQIVEPLGFYVDRRLFRPMLAVATINDATSIEWLQRVVDAVDAFRSEPWTVETISLRQRTLETNPPGSRAIAEIPLGSA